MNVLSLFDGISVARVALDLAQIQVKNYYSSEIDKYAIQVSQKNYPDIIRLGNVCDISSNNFEPIDLLIGGSPCQDLSIAKKGRKGLEGDRSGLFWEYIRIRALVKPKYFILENVASMPQKDKDIITEAMGVEPVMFNASLVSAQTRKRLFWTNIKFELPMDRGIILKDILQPDGEVDERMVNKDKKAYTLTATYMKAFQKNSVERKQRTMVKVGTIGKNVNYCKTKNVLVEEEKNKEIHKTAQTGRNETKKLGYVGDKDHQAKRFYDTEGKLPALNAICNSMVKVGTMGKNYSQGNIVYSPEGKSICLSSRSGGIGANTGLYKIEKTEPEFNIRKLTPIECERLQSLPDNYTEGISNTQRYKSLGNAFNAEVISHILKSMGVEGVSP